MEWSGRAPARPAGDSAYRRECIDKSAPIPKSAHTATVIGIDISKNTFRVVGLNRRGAMSSARSGRAGRSRPTSPTCDRRRLQSAS